MAKEVNLANVNNQTKGFSLIEVLVSLVILVIGLIGIFNLHLVSKRSSFESFQQTQASYYTNDIINRMKLNRTQLLAYNGTYTGQLSLPGTLCDVGVGAAIVVCSNTETRAWDLYSWEQLFTGSFEQISGRGVGGVRYSYSVYSSSSHWSTHCGDDMERDPISFRWCS